MVSGCWIEQIQPTRGSLRISCVQHCQDGVPTELRMFRLMFVLLLASSLGTDLTSLLKELSQREQGKTFI